MVVRETKCNFPVLSHLSPSHNALTNFASRKTYYHDHKYQIHFLFQFIIIDIKTYKQFFFIGYNTIFRHFTFVPINHLHGTGLTDNRNLVMEPKHRWRGRLLNNKPNTIVNCRAQTPF